MRTILLGALGLLLLAPAVQAQNMVFDATFGSVELSEGFVPDPHEVALTAGGDLVPAVEGCNIGRIAEASDYEFHYNASGGSTLYIYAVSGSDTTLLINTAEGAWVCDDDAFGDGDPLVVIPNASGGLYDIWVGTFGDEPAEATLYISEIDPRGR